MRILHIKGTWRVHSINGDYLSIPEGTGSCGYLFHEIPGISNMNLKVASRLKSKGKFVALNLYPYEITVSLYNVHDAMPQNIP